MHDARTLPNGTVLETDTCIIGGGPAGLTVAHQLARRGRRVCLLESGGTEPDEATQQLAGGEVADDPGYPLYPLAFMRARQLGGTGNIWRARVDGIHKAFRSGPLDAIDFERRDWVPYSGWPFDRAHLDPFYRRAQELAQLGPYVYDGAAWERRDAAQLPLDNCVLETTVWQYGTLRRFVCDLREEMEATGRADIWLHANALELETTARGDAVTRVRAATLAGNHFYVAARRFVLAAGGIESPRLLLLSARDRSPGVGNARGLVGRFFMEHQYLNCGTLVPASRELFDRITLYDQRRVDGVPVMAKLQPTEALLRRERRLHFSAFFLPQHRYHRRFRTESVAALAALTRSFGRVHAPLAHVRTVVRGLDYVAVYALHRLSGRRMFAGWTPTTEGWSALPKKSRRFRTVAVHMQTEQVPDPDNRVSLGESRDGLGCRVARVEWRWREADVAGAKGAQELVTRELERAGLGTLRPAVDDCGRPQLMIGGAGHHMGTTRMHTDPTQGVVDEHCRVHGVANLFVAGSSVFPTGGYVNPTLTIVALAIRLADCLACCPR